MDANGFDTLARSFTGARSRRGALVSLLVGGLGLFGPAQTEARKKKRKKKPCPPCKTRKKGKCKSTLPDGTACPGGACQAGSCVTIPCAEACAAGCCSVAGACLPGDAADACGALGRVCQDCAAHGQICVNGQCQPGQQSCLPDSCGACRRCNDTATACEPDPSTETLPCSGAACEDGKEGRCVGGQCECQPIQQACLQVPCEECQQCNATGAACEDDPAKEGTLCSSVTCGAETEGRCAGGQCQCLPVQPTCDSALCPECQRCNATGTACEAGGEYDGLPCDGAPCEGGAISLCVNGQCVCRITS